MEFVFQLFALLLGLSIAELLAGLARSWRISSGATKTRAQVRIGQLVPLLALLLLCDQTRFWIAAYTMRSQLTFSYWTLLVVLAIIGGYYILSTFVFPDDPADWPDFDDYYLATNRMIIGGMLTVNLAGLAHLGYRIAHGMDPSTLPFTQHWTSLTATFLYFPGLLALWFAKSCAANRRILLFMIAMLLIAALVPTL